MRIYALLLGVVVSGCTRIDVNHHAVLPAPGIQLVEASIEAGSFTWVGGLRTANIDLDVWSWGSAANETRARAVEESNDWGALVLDGRAAFWGYSPAVNAGVDFAALGPRRVDVDALALDGIVDVSDLNGDVIVTASGVIAKEIRGSADLFASELGIDATVSPSEGDVVILHAAKGNVRLGLPAGLDYDILAEAPTRHGVFVQDLLYDSYAGGVDWFEGERGNQSITVRVVAERGAVEIYEVGP